ncbi:hypothetical protein, partial [Methanobacterium formicicum]|uniref:hypothetical protein n=1 Tax=Methanobacterium formicicum TaxID=2162 RepID=UPI00248FB04C
YCDMTQRRMAGIEPSFFGGGGCIVLEIFFDSSKNCFFHDFFYGGDVSFKTNIKLIILFY